MAKSIGGPTGPGKGSVMIDPSNIRPRGVLDDQFDVRDILANFVDRGDRDLSNDQARKDYSRMSVIMGAPMAQKVLNHLLIFNQRRDQQNRPFEHKLTSLYDIGSNDKDVDDILKRTSMLSQGPIAGARESVNIGNMSATGRLTSDLSKSTVMTR